jgi:hypothetical protein
MHDTGVLLLIEVEWFGTFVTDHLCLIVGESTSILEAALTSWIDVHTSITEVSLLDWSIVGRFHNFDFLPSWSLAIGISQWSCDIGSLFDTTTSTVISLDIQNESFFARSTLVHTSDLTWSGVPAAGSTGTDILVGGVTTVT